MPVLRLGNAAGVFSGNDLKTHWIIDEEAAAVVREIFRLCVQGYGVSQIAKEITKRHIMNPTAYAKHHGRTIPDNREFAGDLHMGK